MRSIVLVLLVLAAALPPAAGDANYTERNMAYILELAGYREMPEIVIDVEWNGEHVQMAAEEAVRRAAEMHARIDLRSLGENAIAGQVAVNNIGFFARDCTRLVPSQVPQPIGFYPPTYQIEIYHGRADHVLACGSTYTAEWTTKMIQWFDGYPGSRIVGSGSILSLWGLTAGNINGVVLRAPPEGTPEAIQFS